MSVWSAATCETNGVTLHYTRTGGHGSPIVLLHGLVANGACWTPLARTIEGEYDVIMPDARGHGKSSKPKDGYRYEDHAGDVVGFIRSLRLSYPILMGHSMGGMTAALVASQNPSLLRGLILVDPTFLGIEVQRQVHDSDVADQHRAFLSMSLDELVADSRTKHPDRSSEIIELIARARLETSLNAFGVLTPPNPDYKQLVSSINVPTLLVTSDKGVISPAVASELQALNPELRVERIPDAGHGLQYDQPERFANVVSSFLRAIQ